MASDEELIAELWLEVRQSQLDLVHELVADVERVRDDARDTAAWSRIRSTSHRLAGTLGSFGQQPAGETAIALDQLVSGIEEPDRDRVDRATALVVALHQELTHEPGEGSRS